MSQTGGIGSITGKAVNCLGYSLPEFANRGVGLCRGMGAGRGTRRMYCRTGIPSGLAMDEKTILKKQEGLLENQLSQVKERLKDFDEQK
jgi:hypothetical protein